MASQQPGHSRRGKKAGWDTEGTCDLAAPKEDGKKQQQRNTKPQINPIIPRLKANGGATDVAGEQSRVQGVCQQLPVKMKAT